MKYIERDLEVEIKKYLNAKEIIAVVGTRQSGKTTLINKLLDDIERNGKEIKRVSFDNIKELKLFESDIDSFIDLNVKNFDYLFIDEVHYSKDGGKKLKYIYDNHNIKIIISGSSAPEISIQSLKYLVGRIFLFYLYPFSFKEFLRMKDEDLEKVYTKNAYKEEILHRLNKYLKEFILYGGYPRVVFATREEKKKVLESIYSTYLLKEIKEILGLSEDFKLIDLLKNLSLQIGNIINYNELSAINNLSFFELKKHLNILQKSYICGLIKPFHTNKMTELVKNPKVYFIDTGFRNICIDNFSVERTDMGSLFENFIFSELVKKNIDVKFWNTKSKAEVDFIIESQNKIIPIEIKSKIRDNKIEKSFSSFVEKYKSKKGYYLSLDFEGKNKINSCEVNFLPFIKFLQEKVI